MILKIVFFLFGVLVGVAGFFWVMLGGITPPAPQEMRLIDVGIARLAPKDSWLEKVHFQIIPLDGVRSIHGYAILLMTPPPGGVHGPPHEYTYLALTASTAYWTGLTGEPLPGGGVSFSIPEGIQPIEIATMNFGPNGDRPAIKFIDEMYRPNHSYYGQGERLQIGSPAF